MLVNHDIVAIFYMQDGRKFWLSTGTTGVGFNLVPEWTEDYKLAFACDDEPHANRMIQAIRKPVQFQIEWMTVLIEQSAKSKIKAVANLAY